MFGKGLVKGLGITMRHLFNKKVTEFYPEVKPNLPPRTRSSMSLDVPKCISCGLCANACPNKVITFTSDKDANNKKVLTSYVMDTGRCLFCGMCTEACPTKALRNTTEFENTVYHKEDLQWDMIQKYNEKVARGEIKVEPKEEEGKDNG
ncbi:MAG TPA: NADH-quinone oxidoreductase subunit I [Verrucomicrobiae bacterium]|nr:NADH-quinone oxidoreductase subunit I [Verrucomicrobiae bacterium]